MDIILYNDYLIYYLSKEESQISCCHISFILGSLHATLNTAITTNNNVSRESHHFR